LTADKWFKSGVDQAQAIVNGVNSVIENTEFMLKFAVDPTSAAAIGAQFDKNIGTVMAGGTPTFSTPAQVGNPFGPVLGSINASPNMGGGRVSAASVGASSVTVNVNGGDPNAIVAAIQQYVRQTGAVPLTTRAI
jgi:hypothetical protein